MQTAFGRRLLTRPPREEKETQSRFPLDPAEQHDNPCYPRKPGNRP